MGEAGEMVEDDMGVMQKLLFIEVQEQMVDVTLGKLQAFI